MEHHVQAALVAIASHRIGKPRRTIRSGEGTFDIYESQVSQSHISVEIRPRQGTKYSSCRLEGTGSDWKFTLYHKHLGEQKMIDRAYFYEDGTFEASYYDSSPRGQHRVQGSLKGSSCEFKDYSKHTHTWSL